MIVYFGFLLRIYAYLFHLTLSVFLLSSALIRLSRHDSWFDVRSGALMGAMDLVCTLLGFTKWLKLLFAVSAALVLRAAFNGFFVQPYMPAWIPSAATLAFLGALLVLFKSPRNRMPI